MGAGRTRGRDDNANETRPDARVDPFSNDLIDGFLHTPDQARNAAVTLTHGAGGNCQTALMTALADAFVADGFHVLRFNLPFRRKRHSGPPFGADAARDRAGIASAAAHLTSIVHGPIIVAGHSYGGRQASIAAAEGSLACARLVLFSYPLHPPRKPEELRTSHFPNLQTPSLFVHGTADPFGTIEEMREALTVIPAPAVLSVIEGAGHDLKKGRFDILRLVIELLPGADDLVVRA
jgi:predicted alpha/beta-hydrolase family hydrolase